MSKIYTPNAIIETRGLSALAKPSEALPVSPTPEQAQPTAASPVTVAQVPAGTEPKDMAIPTAIIPDMPTPPVQQASTNVDIYKVPTDSNFFKQAPLEGAEPQIKGIQLFTPDTMSIDALYSLPGRPSGVPDFLAFDKGPKSPYGTLLTQEKATGERDYPDKVRIVRHAENMVGLPSADVLRSKKAPPVCSPEFTYNPTSGLCVYNPSFYSDAQKAILSKSKKGFGQ